MISDNLILRLKRLSEDPDIEEAERIFESLTDIEDTEIMAISIPSRDEEGEKRQFEPNVGGGVDRDKLEDSDFVLQDERKFPIVTPKDVADAVSSWGRYKGPASFESFKRKLTALAKRKGDEFVARLPADWKDEKGEKAGRRVRGDKVSVLRALQEKFADVVNGLQGLIKWAGYEDEGEKQAPEPEPVPGEKELESLLADFENLSGQTAFTFKGLDGQDWMLTFTTNAFQDREREIFTTKAINEYVARHVDDEVKGEYWFWHLPGAKFADVKWQAVVGRFLVEAGPFDDTDMGHAFKAFFQKYPEGHPVFAPMGWGMSHGYLYKKADRTDGVYEWFDKKESTVLPLHIASNPYTNMEVIGTMDEQQRAALEAIGGKALVDRVERVGAERTKELESAGVGFKSMDDVPIEGTDEKAKKAGGADEVTALLEKIQDEELRGQVKAMFEKVKAAVKQEPPAEDEEEKQEPGEEDEEEMPPEEEKEKPGKKEVDSTITRQELAAAFGGVVEQLRAEVKSMIAEARDEIMADLKGQLEPVADTVQGLQQSDEDKIAQKAMDVPAQSLQDILNESIFGQASKAKIDGRSTLARGGPEEQAEDIESRTGISGIDWMIAQRPQ